MAKTTKSIEEKVEDYYKQQLNSWDIRTYAKNELINSSTSKALSEAKSKSGGNGGNLPDIKLILDDGYCRRIPVMIEVKGTEGRLEALDKNGEVATGKNAIQRFATNGAIHYARAILDYTND